MKKLLFLFVLLFSTSALADDLPEPVASLLPTPQQIEILEPGAFDLPTEITIYAGEGLEHCAASLKEELAGRFNAPARIVGKEKRAEATVIIELPDGDPDQPKDESYTLRPAGGVVRIAAKSPAGAFYGVQTLIQLLREENGKLIMPYVRIHDWPSLPIRGVTDDISRGQVPTMDDFKRTIRRLAYFKMNTYFIYIEDVFRFDKYPSIGEKRGALTRDEIAELENYAEKHHVEIIPIFQTLGHMENILLQPEFLPLAEFPGAFCLAPLQKKTYEFLGDLLAGVVPAFSSEYFHIGADETWDVGLGRSRGFMPETDVAEIHLRHYERVLEMLKPYDRKIMLYSDMLLRHPDILDTLPRDLIVFDWHYRAAEEFPSLDVFRQSGHRVIVSPAVANWKRFFPDLSTAETNILNFIRRGKRYDNVIGAATSSWGDNGQENFRELNWSGYAVTAEAAWAQTAKPAEEIRNNFFTHFFGDASPEIQKTYKLMDESHRVFTIQGMAFASAHGTTMYWKHPLLDNPDVFYRTRAIRLRKKMRAALKHLENFRPAAKRNAAHLDFIRLGAERNAWMADKIILGSDLGNFLKKSETDDNDLAKITRKIGSLRANLEKQAGSFSDLWLKATRPEGLELNLLKFRYMDKWLEDLKTTLEEKKSTDSLFLESRWIAPSEDDYKPGTECTFRRGFELEARPADAFLQLAADGFAEAFVNGEQVGTALGRFSLSATYNLNKILMWDVGNLLQPGANVVSVKATNYESSNLGVNALLWLLDGEGAAGEIHSDAAWEAACVPQHGWDADTINEELWRPARVPDGPPNPRWGRLLRPDFQAALPSYPGL